jgi:catechol 2,3-dioxygenase-like lactoylglutathione lyase family enzyme
MFSAVPVKYHGVADALLVDRSFILFNKVAAPAPWELVSGIYHIGWGGVDGPSEYDWRTKKGMQWQTGLSTLGKDYYMYAFGPDKEVVEVWTGFQHERFGHVHLFSDDVGAATEWYVKNLGVNGPARTAPKPPAAPKDFKADPKNPMEIFRYLWTSQVTTDNDVTINIFAKPSTDTVNWWADAPVGELQKSDGRTIDHIAFSYRNIQPVYDRMKAAGVEIVDDIKTRPEFGMKSFFVRGPDKVLVEIVEEKPLPESAWEK